MSARGWAMAAVLVAGCGVPPAAPAADDPSVSLPPPDAPALGFEYTLVDGGRITAADVLGRMTIVAFIATYDTASQAEVRLIARVLQRHKPRVNAMAIAMEPEENHPLVQQFAFAMGLPFPLAFADEDTLAGKGPFKGLHHVPSVVLLDRRGREVWRHLGFTSIEELETALAQRERR